MKYRSLLRADPGAGGNLKSTYIVFLFSLPENQVRLRKEEGFCNKSQDCMTNLTRILGGQNLSCQYL